MNEDDQLYFEDSESNSHGETPIKLTEEQIAPWITSTTKKILNPNFRLHNEIIDFYNYIKPNEKTNNIRYKSFELVKDILEKEIKNSFVSPFGSFATQLYLPNSDIDLVIIDNDKTIPQLMKLTKKALNKFPEVFGNIDIINAKVPIIKFTMLQNAIEFDLTFNESKGITNAREVINTLNNHQEAKFLIFIIKLLLRQRHLNNTFQGGVGSYLLFLMVLSFLRNYKEELMYKKRDRLQNATLAEYLINFLGFWGNFKYYSEEIIIENGGKICKKRVPSDILTIYSPINNDNVGTGAFKFKSVFSVFKNRSQFLCNYAFKENESILKYLLNPSNMNFESFLV